jgi:hypothetical protein
MVYTAKICFCSDKEIKTEHYIHMHDKYEPWASDSNLVDAE